MKKENDIKEIIKSNLFLNVFESQDKVIKSAKNKISREFNLFSLRWILMFPKFLYSKMDELPESVMIIFIEHMYNINKIFLKELDISEAISLYKNKIVPFFNTMCNEKMIDDMKKDLFSDNNTEVEVIDDLNKNQKNEKALPFDFKKFLWIYRFIFPIFSPLLYTIGLMMIPLMGNLMEEIMKEEISIDPKNYLIKVANGLNMGINGLKCISEDFKDKYTNEI